MCRRSVRLLLLALCVGASVVVYYNIDPAQSVFAPKCAFRLLTGYDCPACGGQRALHALLHGQWRNALLLNPFLLLSVPYAAAVCYASFGKSARAQSLKRYVCHRVAVWSYVAVFFVWWVVRNTALWHECTGSL